MRIIIEQLTDFTKSTEKIAKAVSQKEGVEISKKSVERCPEVNQLGEIKRKLMKSGLISELNSINKGEEENNPEGEWEIVDLDYFDKYIKKYYIIYSTIWFNKDLPY
ncbi:MAG: hypothetical protein HWN66_09075 [Candidatus Helarchaeota archaeon]|nr:hypothetical protein [Candidatus Helarchaeota archaeon]